MTRQIQPGDWIEGPFWETAVQVVSLEAHEGYDVATVAGRDQVSTRTYVLTPADWEQITRATHADRRRIQFSGDAFRFRLGVRAHRLRLAHSIDPYAALNASRIDPLPHQFEAVYGHLLARPVVRALLAHDAGAGKTIMAGMVIKELERRQDVRRVLIVAPAGLTVQWRRELLTKFGQDFTIVDHDYMRRESLDSLDVWHETDLAITSIDFARQKRMRQALESVEWDLVIADEAHKMAAYRRPNDSIRKTQAYELGEVLAKHTTHFLLMTATPHKGDPENYRLLISLLDPQWGEAAACVEGGNPMVLRRTKEEMRKANGEPLYPERIVEPRYYTISRVEGDLLEQVQKFAKKRYARARSANRQSAAFALLMLERRLASSPCALRESLQRMRDQVAARLEGSAPARASSSPDGEDGDWTAWENLAERDRWEREAQAEAEAAALVSRRRAKTEIRQLDTLIEKADALVRQGNQEKLLALQAACDVWVGEQGKQLITFTEFKDTLDYLVERLAEWGYTTTQIHGGMRTKERRQAEQDFWNGKAQVLVATEAAGEGINLQYCSVMINYDIPWNPCRLEQRMGRIHRYGQEADQVHIFNLVATNTMEDEVKDALLKKLNAMRKDLGDKVFNVVGEVLWGDDLRRALERIALGERKAVDEAKRLIERAEDAVREALAAEARTAVTAEPLDVAGFRRKQATFAAHRLSPEEAEKFFRQAVPFVGGTFEQFAVETKDGALRPAFEVTLPSDLQGRRRRKVRVSFWPEACSDDDSRDDAMFFIAPGHWLFDALLDRVIADCGSDLGQGAVFLDLQPEGESPYLVWFVQSRIRDGLGRRAGDLLAVVQHRADQERVAPLPSEILDAFDLGAGQDLEAEIRQGQAMLGAQDEIIDGCVCERFLPDLTEHQKRQQTTLVRDRRFLEEGLNALAEHLSAASIDAYLNDDEAGAERLVDQSNAVQEHKDALLAELDRAGHLLLSAPDVLGVALVLPAPLELELEGEDGAAKVVMRRDDEVEDAAMQVVMECEIEQGRIPRDVHQGKSWDIESYDDQGNLLRYIEVKGRGPEDANVVTLTEPEWEAARRLGDKHWLYIVRLGDGMLWMIQNPYTKLQPRELKRWVVRVRDAAAQGEAVAWGKAE
ncbi:MAG: helicase-related protein [Chloroflexota bacterium]|nr:helicase-related protein [Chloroflexota bacterium]